MLGWPEWMDIEEKSNYEGCRVFKIRVVNLEGLPVGVPRCLGKDKDGIVYIGHSENIRRRVTFFLGAIEGKEYTSPEGRRLCDDGGNNIYTIGMIHIPFRDVEEMPIQPIGAKGIQGTIEIESEYVDGIKDLEGFSQFTF